MRSVLEAIAGQMVELGRESDPARTSGADAEAIADMARVIGRAAGSIEARFSARAAEANAWRRAGARSAEEWLAGKRGTSKAQAKRTLVLGEQLDRHEELRDRYTTGRVSQDQAEVIGSAADENPDAEAGLLNAAETESLATLRREAAKAKAAVSDEETRQAKLHEQRYASGGSDEEGAYRLGARMSALQSGIFDRSRRFAPASVSVRSRSPRSDTHTSAPHSNRRTPQRRCAYLISPPRRVVERARPNTHT